MNVEREGLFYQPSPWVQSIEGNFPVLFPSSFDIQHSISCGSLSLLPTAAAERRISYGNPLEVLRNAEPGEHSNQHGSSTTACRRMSQL